MWDETISLGVVTITPYPFVNCKPETILPKLASVARDLPLY